MLSNNFQLMAGGRKRWNILGKKELKQGVAQSGTLKGPVLGPNEIITI